MKLEEGIEILKEIDKTRPTVDLYHWREAVKLGIEAMKAVQKTRRNEHFVPVIPLPGETKE